ncbi:integrin beta-7 [Silurus meridionalis]|nr:integrin beta-7 [Silurus meridionalis]
MEDYPSVGHLSQVLQANNIQLIFAVTNNSYPEYKNLSSTLLLEHNITVPGLHVSYKSDCKGQSSNAWQHRGECSGIQKEKVLFTVRLNASECLAAPTTFEIQMMGINEVLKVTVETMCDCDCGAKEENSKHCAGNGTLDCGICRCNKDYVGQYCKCNSMSDSTMRMSCRQNNSFQECSGKDNGVCKCGVCECNEKYSGSACECPKDTSMCGQKQNLCSGQGRPCMECTLMKEQCLDACVSVRMSRVEFSHTLKCVHLNSTYDVSLDNDGNVVITYAYLPGSVDKTKVIIGASVSSIIFIGILIIIIYKILLVLYDQREYRNFIKAQENTKWDEILQSDPDVLLMWNTVSRMVKKEILITECSRSHFFTFL